MNGQTAARPRSRLRRMSASLIGAASALWLSGVSWMPTAAASRALDNVDSQIEQTVPPPQTPSVEQSNSNVPVETGTEAVDSVTESETLVNPADTIPWNRLEQVIYSERDAFVPDASNVPASSPEPAEPTYPDSSTQESSYETSTAAQSASLRRMQLLHEPGMGTASRSSSARNHFAESESVEARDSGNPNVTETSGGINSNGDINNNVTAPSASTDFVTQQQPAANAFTNPIEPSSPSGVNELEAVPTASSIEPPAEPVLAVPVPSSGRVSPSPSISPSPFRFSSASVPVPVPQVTPQSRQAAPFRLDQAPIALSTSDVAALPSRSTTASAPVIPSGYVEISDGIYVPEAFMHYDLQFRQAREARLQAWEAYQSALYNQSAMIAALLSSELWQSDRDGSNPYLDQVAFSANSLSELRIAPTNMSATASIPTAVTSSFQLRFPLYSGMVNAPSIVSTFATDTFPLYPLPSPVEITSPHGWRIHPISGQHAFHQGVDLGAPAGTPVLATLSGVVESSGWNGGYGNTVTIRHLNGNLQTLYAHLSQAYVEPGEAVKQGQIIGVVGSTGNSTGPHLHYEMNQLASTGWESIDNTDFVTFAQQLLERQQYLQHYSQFLQPNQANQFRNGQLTSSAYPSNSQLYSASSSSSPSTASVANEIRVGIELDVDSFTVGSTVPLTITDTNNQPIAAIAGGASYSVTRSANGGIAIGGQTYDTTAIFVQPASPDPNAQVAIDGRFYRGRLLIGARPQGGVSAINWVDQEQYLYSVVGSEVYPSWNAEALRAQAVAARSYSTYYRYNPVSPDWYDIGDDTYYQAYSGSAREYSTTTQAVNDTRGQVLMQGNAVLQAMYASTRELSIEAHGGRGMAQWGAADKAAAGWNYTAILSHYYPGSQLAVMN